MIDATENCWTNRSACLSAMPNIRYGAIESPDFQDWPPKKVYQGMAQNDSRNSSKYYNVSEEILKSKGSEMDWWIMQSLKPENYLFSFNAFNLLREELVSGCLDGEYWEIPWGECEQKVEMVINSFNIQFNLTKYEEVVKQYQRVKDQGFGNLLEDIDGKKI